MSLLELDAPATATCAAQWRGMPLLSARFVLSIAVAISAHAALLMPMALSVSRGPELVTAPVLNARIISSLRAESVALPTMPSPESEQSAAVPSTRAAPGAPLQGELARHSATMREVTDGPSGAASRTEMIAGVDPAASAASAASPAPAGLPPAPNYLLGGTLDPGPRPLDEIDPVYPSRAGQQQGVVVLRLLINEFGIVDNAAVVRSSPAGYFEDSALAAFGAARFSPGKLLGTPVKSQVTIEVEFTPINRGAAVSGRSY